MTINTITYAGHSAIFLNSTNYVIAIDPWLHGNPACPDSLQNPEKLDLIILSHGHSDHASDTVRLARKTGAKVAATYELAMLLIQSGVDENQVLPMNKGGCIKENDFQISLTHAMHSSSFDTENGAVYAGEACGIVVKDGKNVFYHAGDTALFSDLELIKNRHKPTYAFLPIGDRFTMGPKDAACAAKIIQANYLIPIHYKTFGMLTGTLDEFRSACEKEKVQARVLGLAAGESFQVVNN